jgi:anti-sigma regulatory factor (Ser/Thr protein kinase)
MPEQFPMSFAVPGASPVESEVVWRFPYDPRSVRWARALIRAVSTAWRLSDDVRDASALLLSELVTNAYEHGRPDGDASAGGTRITVRCLLIRDRTRLRIEVSDAYRSVPRARPAGLDDESGRGLLLVAALAAEWGVEVHPDGSGKTVWLEYDIP